MDNCSEVWEKLKAGHGATARGACLRAAEYLRQAFFSAATTWTGASFAVRVSGRLDSLLSR